LFDDAPTPMDLPDVLLNKFPRAMTRGAAICGVHLALPKR